MKTVTSLLLATAALSVPLAAQQQPPSQETLVKLRDEKLAKPVFQKAPWGFDYDAARSEAKQQGKLIFAYFTRSYAH